jgi:drug/metabolite transporter (DMT)-like permease
MNAPQINLVLAWAGILLGFLSGLALGLFFHREDWLGGYTSFRRRLYRLAHISFFGLAAVNLLFYFTARTITASAATLSFASWAFIVGAISMPACCILVAHRPRSRVLFALPVISLVAGGTLTLLEVIKL